MTNVAAVPPDSYSQVVMSFRHIHAYCGGVWLRLTEHLSISPHPHFRLEVVCKMGHVLYIVAVLIMLAPYVVIKVNNRPTSEF